MVSLRGGALRLLALRGAMAVDRRRVHDVELVAGVTVHFAKGVALHVIEVSLPPEVMALSIDGGPSVPLTGSVQSLIGSPLRLSAGFQADALAHLWWSGDDWFVREGEARARTLAVDEVVEVGGAQLRLQAVAIERAGAGSTVDAGKLHPALHIVARYHSVHIHRVGRPVLTLSGQPAQLLSELVAMDGPVEWSVLASQVWRRLKRRDALRKKLDAALARLRKKLADGDVRDDLVRSDGTGHIELVLYNGDRVEDLA